MKNIIINKLEKETNRKFKKYTIRKEQNLLHLYATTDFENVEAYIDPSRYTILGLNAYPKAIQEYRY